MFKRIIEFLNRMKVIDLWEDKMEGVSDKEKQYMDRFPTQNPYGLISLILGGVAFTFGPQYGFIPVISFTFCIVTLFTFDKEKEDNPWTFYLGIVLSLIGLSMFIGGVTHEFII
ncbi:cell division protein FtsK [Sporosarcina sp. P13]|uniref:cell division protein FtsK n=1 Tax=Sporosarcina sp. P13 TaxID=2048263 RepID=UPI003513FAB3